MGNRIAKHGRQEEEGYLQAQTKHSTHLDVALEL
jgi:hypothetical protein